MTIKDDYKEQISKAKFFLTLDVGGRLDAGTAVALHLGNKHKPTLTKTFFSSVTNWDMRVNHICYTFKLWLEELNRPCFAFIEKPEFWDTHKGMTTARSDSLFKLIFVYARLYEILFQLDYIPVGVTAKEWKGNLNKNQMAFRINRVLDTNYEGDVADAVGLGLYLKGLL